MKTYQTELFIKNMVCQRCIRVVQEGLVELDFEVKEIELGRVSVEGHIPSGILPQIDQFLQQNGFERIKDAEGKIVEQIKTTVIQHIHVGKQKPSHINFSDYLSQKTGISYYKLSKLFSRGMGITLEKYIIQQKIERCKELISYGEKKLTEIATELEYSSVQHLSGQFKKVTGLSPSEFKRQNSPNRRGLDQI